MSAKNRFIFVSFDDDKRAKSTILRAHAIDFADSIEVHTKPGREQSLALTKLEEAVFWLNSSLAKESTVVEA